MTRAFNEIRPRKVPMWRFFDEHPEATGHVCLGRIEGLGSGSKRAAEFFIEAMRGGRAVLDVGCGAGLPALYVAPHVGEVVGVDAAPNMIAVARRNATQLGLTNVSFQIAGTEGLPFGDEAFDGACLCGVLGSMDWGQVRQMTSEVWRVLAPGGRIAVLEEDWHGVLGTRPLRQEEVRIEKGRLVYRIVERESCPRLERDIRYLIAPGSPSDRKLRGLLDDKEATHTVMCPEGLARNDILDAWYDEGARFDASTLHDLMEAKGFCDITIESRLLWNEAMLLLTAMRQ